jgi:hypothetical protein
MSYQKSAKQIKIYSSKLPPFALMTGLQTLGVLLAFSQPASPGLLFQQS